MGFFHAKKTKIYINGYNLSSWFDTVDSPMNADNVETTVFNVDDKLYIMGNKTVTLTAEGFYDDSTGASEEALLAAFGTTAIEVSYYMYGDTTGYYGYGMKALNTAYQISGSITGASRVMAGFQSDVGKEQLISLKSLAETILSTSASAVEGTASTNGCSAYLHVTANDSTGLAPILEHSTSGSTWDTLLSFDVCTGGRASERDVASGTVKAYVRATWTTTEAATFQIGLCRY